MIRESNVIRLFGETIELPLADNTSEAVAIYRAANERFRQVIWPEPYNQTTHRLWRGDARDLSVIPDKSVHLVVTSPPYWTLKNMLEQRGNLGR